MKIIKQNEFEEIVNNGYTLVDFFANWCGPCKMLGPVLEELSEEYDNVTFVKVDVDDSIELAQKFNVMSIPTIYMFKDGQTIATTGGYKDKANMKAFIDSALNS